MAKASKETKQALKAQRKATYLKRKEQRRVFKENTDKLFAREYRYSERFEKSHVQDDGKAYINVDLTKVESPFSIYSYDQRLDQEIFDYVDSEAFYLRATIPLVLNFDDGGKYSQTLKDKIRKAVVRHYTLDYEDKRMEFRKNRIFGALILVIGASFLALYVFLTLFLENYLRFTDTVILEIICILSWVFIWESVNRFFFSGTEKKIEMLNAGQLALMEVTFGEPVYHERIDK